MLSTGNTSLICLHSETFSYCIAIDKTVMASSISLDKKRECPICKDVVKETELQNHMGAHIIRAMCGVREQKLIKEVNLNAV